MDWAGVAGPRIVALVGALVGALGAAGITSACGGATGRPSTPLASDTAPSKPSIGLSATRTTSSSSLAYRVALTRRYLLSVELGTRFELVISKRPGSGAEKHEARRIDLGKADYDILALVADDDGRRAFVASSAGWVRGYRLADSALLSEWRMGSGATALALSDDGQTLLIGTATGVICLRRLLDGAQLQCVVAHTDRVAALDIHQGRIASGSWDGGLALWSLPTLRTRARRHDAGYVSDVAFSGDGHALAVARNHRKPVRTPTLNADEKRSPSVDPIGENFIEVHAVGGFPAATPERLEGHRSVVTAVAWAGTDLVSTSWDRTVQLWNTLSPSQHRKLLSLDHLGSDVDTSRLGGEISVASWAVEVDDDDGSSVTWFRLLYEPH